MVRYGGDENKLTKQELFDKYWKEIVTSHYALGDEDLVPDWFVEYYIDFVDCPRDVAYTLGEFAGKFNITKEAALYAIRKHKLFGCGAEFGSMSKEFYIPLPEADRYAAILEAEKLATTPPVKHPCLDHEHPFYAKELALALKAWEYAVTQKPTATNFKQKIEAFLQREGAGSNQLDRIKTVCGTSKRGPRPKKK